MKYEADTNKYKDLMSLPMRERGLKYYWCNSFHFSVPSLPMRGARIEILLHRQPRIGNKKALKGAFLFFSIFFDFPSMLLLSHRARR